jgi:hypothetical protein
MAVAATTPDYIIAETPFNAAAISFNFATGTHTDDQDLPGVLGAMTVVRGGRYEGGLLVFPKFRVAFDLYSGDLLLSDVHELHGNTALRSIPGQGIYRRQAVVCYYHQSIRHCRR